VSLAPGHGGAAEYCSSMREWRDSRTSVRRPADCQLGVVSTRFARNSASLVQNNRNGGHVEC